MKLKIMYLIITLVLFGCSSSKKQVDFILYEKPKSPTINADTEVLQDIFFTLSIPNNIKKEVHITSYYYSHELNFGKNEAIIILYFPSSTENFDINAENISSDYFKKILTDINLLNIINSNIKILKNRRFGILSIKPNMLIMYLNVKENNISMFKHSINSIQFYDSIKN